MPIYVKRYTESSISFIIITLERLLLIHNLQLGISVFFPMSVESRWYESMPDVHLPFLKELNVIWTSSTPTTAGRKSGTGKE